MPIPGNADNDVQNAFSTTVAVLVGCGNGVEATGDPGFPVAGFVPGFAGLFGVGLLTAGHPRLNVLHTHDGGV
jgi:hypothetical protein